MNTQYVTIWSRSSMAASWVIERTHTSDYAKVLIGVGEPGEWTTINGRDYGIFSEGTNPNVKTK